MITLSLPMCSSFLSPQGGRPTSGLCSMCCAAGREPGVVRLEPAWLLTQTPRYTPQPYLPESPRCVRPARCLPASRQSRPRRSREPDPQSRILGRFRREPAPLLFCATPLLASGPFGARRRTQLIIAPGETTHSLHACTNRQGEHQGELAVGEGGPIKRTAY